MLAHHVIWLNKIGGKILDKDILQIYPPFNSSRFRYKSSSTSWLGEKKIKVHLKGLSATKQRLQARKLEDSWASDEVTTKSLRMSCEID